MRYIIIFTIFISIRLFASEKEVLCATINSEITDEKGKLVNTTYTLKVLLVEFSDVKHDPKYTITDWMNLFFSKWIYASPQMTSPDGQQVYGSMRDYYDIMSNGHFELSGYILNPDSNKDGTPDWLTLPQTKNYYHKGRYYDFNRDIKRQAVAAGLNIYSDSTTKLCIIYAGQLYRGNGMLIPRASSAKYVMSEKFAPGAPYEAERTDATFSGIGIHCHEFGHILGWPDTYHYAQSNTFWTLMACGQFNNNTHAPAALCPEFRIAKGWVKAVEIKTDTTVLAAYNLKQPQIFKICFNDAPGRYFLIENRHFNAKMNFNSTMIKDYNSFLPWNGINNPENLAQQGLLVWVFKKQLTHPADPDWSYLIQADGENNAFCPYNTAENDDNTGYHTGDSGDPFPGYSGNRIFSPWSFPENLSSGPSPSSYPSQNVGFEIKEMAQDYIKVDLYYNNPQQARPQRPWFIDTLTIDNHPAMIWDANSEPDFSHYEIWKNGTFYRALTDTFFIDSSVFIYQESQQKAHDVAYTILAKDTEGDSSLFSRKLTFLVQGSDLKTALAASDIDRQNGENAFYLAANYPNPFNAITNFEYSVGANNHSPVQVELTIYNPLGQKVATLLDKKQQAGTYKVQWDASGFSSGVYLYRLRTDKGFVQTRKLILLK